MTIFLLTAVILGLCLLGMCFNILFRKDGKFPEYEVGSNEEMKKLGIMCFKDEDALLHKKKACSGNYSEACKDCGLFKNKKTV